MTARKYDATKKRPHLFPMNARYYLGDVISLDGIYAVIEAFEYGARKYATADSPGEDNWRSGFSWLAMYNSCRRHIDAHEAGHWWDEESSLPNLAHAMWWAVVITEHQLCGLGTKDLPSYGTLEHTLDTIAMQEDLAAPLDLWFIQPRRSLLRQLVSRLDNAYCTAFNEDVNPIYGTYSKSKEERDEEEDWEVVYSTAFGVGKEPGEE